MEVIRSSEEAKFIESIDDPAREYNGYSFKEIKENAGEVPVLANTGVTSETVEDILKEVDGAIIGTAFKVDGITWNPVSQERVNKLIQKVSSLRKNLKK